MLTIQIDGIIPTLGWLVKWTTGLFMTIGLLLISSVFEVQQYREIAARSSGYFIIADHGSVHRVIHDECTDLDNDSARGGLDDVDAHEGLVDDSAPEGTDHDSAHEGLDDDSARVGLDDVDVHEGLDGGNPEGLDDVVSDR